MNKLERDLYAILCAGYPKSIVCLPLENLYDKDSKVWVLGDKRFNRAKVLAALANLVVLGLVKTTMSNYYVATSPTEIARWKSKK